MCDSESHLFSRPDTGDSNESCLCDNQTLTGTILAQNFIREKYLAYPNFVRNSVLIGNLRSYDSFPLFNCNFA